MVSFTRGVRGTRVADRLDFEIDVELETGLITGHAGVPGLIEAFRQTGTAAVIDREIKLKHRKRGLSASEMVESDKYAFAAYCLTEKCSQRVKRCLTKHAPVASLASGRATAPLPFHKSMLTDVGPVELWATPLRRPSAAANPQGSSRRL